MSDARTAEWRFQLGYAALLTHELDAVLREEWRVLPVTAWLPESLGALVFIAAHVPLVALLQHGVGHPEPRRRAGWQRAVSAFLVVHLGLHLAFRHHPDYDFHSPLSQALIVGGALFGAWDLLARWPRRAAR
ncbi:MAG TPA: DUF6713 family protein [Nevskiaceae bacterium]|nr:DUF6713 family protein [Nevskiaceae bacterium]